MVIPYLIFQSGKENGTLCSLKELYVSTRHVNCVNKQMLLVSHFLSTNGGPFVGKNIFRKRKHNFFVTPCTKLLVQGMQ